MLICLKTLQTEKKLITIKDLRYLISGGISLVAFQPNPCPEWLSDKKWANIEELAKYISAYKNLDINFAQDSKNWYDVF